MSSPKTVRLSNEQIRAMKGRTDWAKVKAATDEQIEQWKHEDGINDADFGPPRLVVPQTDVHALRDRLGLSREEFATRFCLSPRTVEQWEQHRREPDGPARVLLFLISKNPSIIEQELAIKE
jgi:putative transcriptional regulator